jgi:cobalt-zinc-cadmium efflux system membrane fusion protein
MHNSIARPRSLIWSSSALSIWEVGNRKMPKFVLLCSIFTALFAIILSGCGARGSEAKADTATPPGNPLEITVRADLMRQIRVGEPKWEQVSGTLRVAGRVEADETRMARVSAPVTGRIMDLDVIEGQVVTRGQVLATIHSTDLSAVESTFLKADSQYQLADRAVARARQLLDAGVIGEAELQRRDTELQQAGAELSSAREQLRVLGISDEALAKLQKTRAVDSLIHVVSSISGRVLERKVTIGQIVQAAETVCVVADLSNVWLVADVPEQTAGTIRTGKAVQAEIPALPGETITGKLTYVSAIVNPETRTVRMRMDLPNPDRRYKPAMLATITLVDNAERRRIVPANAIVREGNEDNVFVQTGPEKFVLRHVTLGPEFRDGRSLLDGVSAGDKIVLDGAFHLNNERKRLLLQSSEGA